MMIWKYIFETLPLLGVFSSNPEHRYDKFCSDRPWNSISWMIQKFNFQLNSQPEPTCAACVWGGDLPSSSPPSSTSTSSSSSSTLSQSPSSTSPKFYDVYQILLLNFWFLSFFIKILIFIILCIFRTWNVTIGCRWVERLEVGRRRRTTMRRSPEERRSTLLSGGEGPGNIFLRFPVTDPSPFYSDASHSKIVTFLLSKQNQNTSSHVHLFTFPHFL